MTDEVRDNQIMHFVALKTIQKTADVEFEKQKDSLGKLIPSADIQHVGSTAVPGSITKGDVDIQVRVQEDEFEDARKQLVQHYNSNHKDEIWRNGFASFEDYDNPVIPVGIQLTVIGSKYDEFHKIRDLFISNPALLTKYNEIKRSCEGKTYAQYRKQKRKLFGINGANPLLLK